MGLLHEEVTAKIIEACFEVSNELGAGFLESVYQQAMLVALTQKGLRVRSQAPISVMFRGQSVGEFCADILVEDKVIVELKEEKQDVQDAQDRPLIQRVNPVYPVYPVH